MRYTVRGLVLLLVVLGACQRDGSPADVASAPEDAGTVIDAGPARPRGAIASRTMIAMPDGKRLDTRVFVPAGSGRVPTLLVRNCYRHVDDDAAIATAARFHTDRGYAYVWQSVRGTARSEGIFYPYVDEVPDGVATTEWIVAQDWSDGAIGTMGGSYLAFTAVAAAVSNPRVKIVISDDGTIDERSSHRGGVVWGYLLNWLNLVERGAFFDDDTQYPTITNALDPLTLDQATLARSSTYWRDLMANVDDPLFPKKGSLEPRAAELCVPILHVYSPTTGWNDPVDIHRAATTRGCEQQRGNQRLYVVAESHTHHIGRLETEKTYVTEAMLAALDRVLLQHLPGLGPGPAVSYAVIGESAPRTASHWPPPGSGTRTFYLGAASGEAPLVASAPAPGQVAIASDPAGDPCVSKAPPQWFTTAPLTEPLVIAGAARLELDVRTDLRDFDLFATMYDYDSATEAYAAIGSASFRARYRKGAGAVPALMTPGLVERVGMDFVHAAHRVPKGHSVTFSLAPSLCAYLENPQTGAPVTAQTARAAGTITIETGGASPSRLVLPSAP